jgi:hypothetical protein
LPISAFVAHIRRTPDIAPAKDVARRHSPAGLGLKDEASSVP